MGDVRQRDRERGGRSKDGDGPGPGLKYTQTIMGPDRTGGMGMRVSGRRTSRDWAGKIGTQGTGYAATGTAPQVSPIYESTPTKRSSRRWTTASSHRKVTAESRFRSRASRSTELA